jgi:hypothetical protein
MSDGEVYAWGRNLEGQLGDGSTVAAGGGPQNCDCSPSPVEVALPGSSPAVAVAGGQYHSLALLRNGTVYAWGLNNDGQVGNGTSSGAENLGGGDCACIDTPVQVQGLSNVVAVAAGSYSSYALEADGTMWAWGDNTYGELGNGTTTASDVPVEIGSLIGDVTAIGSGPSSDTVLATVVPGSADLVAALSGPSVAVDGTTFTETLKVTNDGPNTANTVLTGINVPPGLSVASPGTGGKPYRGSVLWLQPSLAAGSTVTDTVTFSVPLTAPSTATVYGAGFSQTNDPDPDNGVSSATVRLLGPGSIVNPSSQVATRPGAATAASILQQFRQDLAALGH